MKNMGVRHLVLVAPRVRAHARAATAMAVHARDVLDRARAVDTLADAVADCGLVVGTTCRGGPYRAAAEPPETVAPLILERARHGPVALVFGPEDHGLSNDDLKACQRLIRIPTSAAYASLNLAQAVLVCCYELRRALRSRARPGPPLARPATAGTIEFALERLQAALLRIGFLYPQNAEHIMFTIRAMLGRAGLDPREVRIILGLARQIEWYARGARA